jgi:hypothetical protein
MEHSGQRPTIISHALHTLERNTSNGKYWTSEYSPEGGVEGVWHTYALLWEQDADAGDDRITFMVDGVATAVQYQPHGVEDTFLLRERRYDLLNPANDTVVLGKDILSLTGASASADKDALSQLHRTEHNLRADYTLGIAQALAAAERTMTTLIEQTSEAIRTEVSDTYATNALLQSSISTAMTQLADSFNFEFTSLRLKVDGNDAEAREQFETLHKYIRFENGDILLGESGNELTLRIENDRIGFWDGGAEVAYFSNKKLVVLDGHFLNSLRIGPIAIIPR